MKSILKKKVTLNPQTKKIQKAPKKALDAANPPTSQPLKKKNKMNRLALDQKTTKEVF